MRVSAAETLVRQKADEDGDQVLQGMGSEGLGLLPLTAVVEVN